MLAACATPYAARGEAGGFSETQLDRNEWVVRFDGNGFTSQEQVADYLLLRSAELTLAAGFRYFILVAQQDQTSYGTYTTPTHTETTATVTSHGNTAYGTAQSTTYGGQTVYIPKPGREALIRCFAERPDFWGTIHDAESVRDSLMVKHGMAQPGISMPPRERAE